MGEGLDHLRGHVLGGDEVDVVAAVGLEFQHQVGEAVGAQGAAAPG